MTILLAYTPTEPGQAASAVAIDEAKAHGTDLLIVNTVRGGALVESNAASADELTAIVEQARAAGVEASVSQPENPDVVEAVLDAAREHQVREIVIGIRHRSPVGKLLLGSVAQRIILDAACPVLAVKPTA